MIVYHATGDHNQLLQVLRLYPRIVAAGSPLIGKIDSGERDAQGRPIYVIPTLEREGVGKGHRAKWANVREPTDAELRTVRRSIVVETPRPEPGGGQQVRPGPIEFDVQADVWRTTWVTEAIPVPVPESVLRHHIVRVLSPAQRQAVANYFNGLPASDPMREDWQSMTEVHRDDAVVEALRVALNRTHTQVNQLFIAAGAQRVRTPTEGLESTGGSKNARD